MSHGYGHGRVPSFASKDDAAAWYATHVNAAGPRTHIFKTVTTWRAVERELLSVARALPAPVRTAVDHEVDTAPANITAALAATVYASAAVNPDAVLNTLRYLYVHTRCGIWVSIRKGVVAAFVPFANAAYQNTYGDRIRLTASGLTVSQYAEHKAQTLGRRPERLLQDPGTWWMNGGILCNVMPATVWGDEYVAALRDMLDETCIRHAVPDVDFFINKRDYPQLRRDGAEPYGEFVGESALDRETYSAYVPVFSFYTGTEVADVPMPTTEDWVLATGRCFPPGSTAPPVDTPQATTTAVPVPDREQRAVFRGTATGRGVTADTNTRLRLSVFGTDRPDLIDAGVTAFNTRDKVVVAAASPYDAIQVDFYSTVRHSHGIRRVPFMPMAVQFSKYAYILYADGHCAASRYGSLMTSGAVILRVDSQSVRTSGHLWLFHNLVAAHIPIPGSGVEPELPETADHFRISADLANLEATILYLRSHPEVVDQTVTAARRRAPTVGSVTLFWYAALCSVHAKTVPKAAAKAAQTATDRDWFTPYESKYAGIKTGRCDPVVSFMSI